MFIGLNLIVVKKMFLIDIFLFSDTISICLVTWFTSIFGGFAIFTVLGQLIIVEREKTTVASMNF